MCDDRNREVGNVGNKYDDTVLEVRRQCEATSLAGPLGGARLKRVLASECCVVIEVLDVEPS